MSENGDSGTKLFVKSALNAGLLAWKTSRRPAEDNLTIRDRQIIAVHS